jgi:NO-binding membrane sensor protein with MHYT domain
MGALFGLGVWATSYLGWLPVSGVRQPVTYDPVARTGLMVAAHLAWGAAAGVILAATASRT